MRKLAVAALVLALTGCSTSVVEPTPSASAPAFAPVAELLPVDLDGVSAETTQVEGTRLADALQALIDGIINVDDKSQVVPADGDTAEYYAVYRTISLDPAADPLIMGAQLTSILQESGWELYETTNQDGQYLAALSAGGDDEPWFALIGGDATVEGQSVVTFQIAGPDIP